MTCRARQPETSGQVGQILPLTAIFITVLLGFGVLVLDVARVYALQRYERSVADAAALAGAQDLQVAGTRGIDASQYTAARQHALDLLNRELGGGAACGANPAADIVDCPVGEYLVSIRTDPSPSAVDVEPERAIQVTVRQPNVSLTLARIPPFSMTTWNVGITSVAGITFVGKYGVVTLRPPNGVDTGDALGNLKLDGTGTVLQLTGGDIGTNRSALENGGSSIELDPGYKIYHFDPPVAWEIPPPGHRIRTLIRDPDYRIPLPDLAPATYASASDGKDTPEACLSIVTTWLMPDAGYRTYVPVVSATGAPDMSKINCYKQGVYNDILSDRNGELTVLEPGLYFFNGRSGGSPQAIALRSSLIGGYEPGAPGVAIVIPRQKWFQNNNTGVVSLNAGTRFGNVATGVEATAALDYSNVPIVTNTDPSLIQTVMVQKDSACTVTQPYPAGCHDTENAALNLNGGSALYLAGVQYAPSDNAQLAGGVVGGGYVGQIVAWTLKYSGGTVIRQEYPGPDANGVVRLDAACSGPGTPCNNP